MIRFSVFLATSIILAAPAWAEGELHAPGGAICIGFGPQAPRDIDRPAGANGVSFGTAPAAAQLDLCNIHMHKNAEHKAAAFSIYAGDGDGHGNDSGFKCALGEGLSAAELAPTPAPICAGEHGALKPGDTIEVHWVYSSCEVRPGPTLGSCLSDSCKNPQLRVEAQVFTLVNDPKALDFATLEYTGGLRAGRHQPDALPVNTGVPVSYQGSTTGPSYNAVQCSPYQVTWSVRPSCAKLDIASIGRFCERNVFDEHHAHGVRALVTEKSLLSWIE